MAYYAVKPPPGIYQNGTIFQSAGRWYDSNLTRFIEGAVQPIGGWQIRSASAAAFVGAARALISWRDNSANSWIAVGTHEKLYVQTEAGANFDITPTSFTAGRADAGQNVGYGGGTYGSGFYGAPPTNTGAFLPATVWSLDNWGEDLVGCADSDGRIVQWTLSEGTPAAVVANAPTSCQGLVVTQEGFLFALAADGDQRKVAWCDQQNITQWTTETTNQAGDFDLETAGTLQCGKALTSGALIFTDVDTWLASFIGGSLVYSFQRVGSGCGVISKGCVAGRDSQAVWMGQGGFWFFDGQSVQPLDCDAYQAVYGNLNPSQQSKITAVHLASQGEVWWFYPSASSNENDSYVIWHYRESIRLGANIWSLGQLQRTAGSGRGVYPSPLMVDASGYLWQHETGSNYGGAQPKIETGPMEIGEGDRLAEIQRIIPDQFADGNWDITLYGRLYPNGPEFSLGPLSLVSPTDLLFQAREIRLQFTAATASAGPIGTMRIDWIPGDAI